MLRAARGPGASSSAVDRYVASCDELLTALIVAAYDALGIAARAQEAAVARSASYEASPKDSARTGPPSPSSPRPTAPAPSKATSTASK